MSFCCYDCCRSYCFGCSQLQVQSQAGFRKIDESLLRPNEMERERVNERTRGRIQFNLSKHTYTLAAFLLTLTHHAIVSTDSSWLTKEAHRLLVCLSWLGKPANYWRTGSCRCANRTISVMQSGFTNTKHTQS